MIMNSTNRSTNLYLTLSLVVASRRELLVAIFYEEGKGGENYRIIIIIISRHCAFSQKSFSEPGPVKKIQIWDRYSR